MSSNWPDFRILNTEEENIVYYSIVARYDANKDSDDPYMQRYAQKCLELMRRIRPV